MSAKPKSREPGSPLAFPLFERMMNWFEKWFDQSPVTDHPESPVEYYVTGKEQWKAAKCWSSSPTGWIKLYFSSEGSLQPGHPHSESSLCFRYDPLDPRPTLGGNVFPFVRLKAGPMDQRELEKRSDTLILTTEPFAVPVMISGMLRAVLYISSSAPDTDFTVAVSEVYPDGRSELLRDSIVRMRFLESPSKSRPITPGAVYKANMNVGNIAHVLNAGNRLRLAISSSNFPKFSRNLNSLEPPELCGEPQVARQTVHCGGLRASYLHVGFTDLPAMHELFAQTQETNSPVSV